LRSSSYALQSGECKRASLETELSLQLVDAEVPIRSFPLQHAKGDEAAGHVVLLSPVRACLTAGQPELILQDSDDFFDVRVATHKTIDLVFLTQVYKLTRARPIRSRA
jgi:hypothetical protein